MIEESELNVLGSLPTFPLLARVRSTGTVVRFLNNQGGHVVNVGRSGLLVQLFSHVTTDDVLNDTSWVLLPAGSTVNITLTQE